MPLWKPEILPQGMYRASIDQLESGAYMFQALPRRGDWCVECIEEDLDVLIAKANAWCEGELPAGFYTSSL